MQATNKQTIKYKLFRREWFRAFFVQNEKTDKGKTSSAICFISTIITIVVIIVTILSHASFFFALAHTYSCFSKESNQSIEFSVTINKEASGLGLEIVGGSDTYLVS